MRLLVLDIETPWIRSLFEAMPDGVSVDFLGVLNIRERKFKRQFTFLGMFQRRRVGMRHTEQYVWTLSRLRCLTRVLLWCYGKLMFRARRRPDVIVATDPWKLRLLGTFSNIPTLYYAHDVFEYYPHWNRSQVREYEQKLLERCQGVAAVARKLQKDFRSRVAKDVLYLPMAADSRWLSRHAPDRPIDLPIGKPIVGCTGNINGTYDWGLIEQVAAKQPEFFFVFLGPNIEGNAEILAEIERIFAMPNVRWLGAKRHEELRSYMAWFDVCLCALKPNEHNNRRSPLRLFDYLTTDRPVISTDIAEAHEHEPHVLIARNVATCMLYLQKIKSGEYMPDLAARRRYLQGQTWEVRAQSLLEYIQAHCPNHQQVSVKGCRAYYR